MDASIAARAASFLFLSVAAVALFGFIAVATWADARRKEREAYYKSETLKKLAETQDAAAVVDLLREEHREAALRQRDGLRLGGLVTIAVGVGLIISMPFLTHEVRLSAVGAIPLLIGAALFGYSWFVTPRAEVKSGDQP
jgi:hypothetical protein